MLSIIFSLQMLRARGDKQAAGGNEKNSLEFESRIYDLQYWRKSYYNTKKKIR
jgi:hypothetical protein